MISTIGLFALIAALLLAAGLVVRRVRRPATVRCGVAGLAVLALAGVFFWRLFQTGDDYTPNRLPPDLIDKPAPAISLSPLYAGRPGLQAADLKGHVILVSFFASWCLPCRAEHPLLGRVAQSGITVYGISYKDAPEAAQKFLADHGNPYARVAADRDGRTGARFGVAGVPESFLIDKHGIIRFKASGPLTEAMLKNDILPLAARLEWPLTGPCTDGCARLARPR